MIKENKLCLEKKVVIFEDAKYKQKNLRNKIYQEKWQYEEQLLTAKIVTIQGRDYKDLVTI